MNYKRLNYNVPETIQVKEITDKHFIMAFKQGKAICFIEKDNDDYWQGFSNNLRQFSRYPCFDTLIKELKLEDTELLVYEKPF